MNWLRNILRLFIASASAAALAGCGGTGLQMPGMGSTPQVEARPAAPPVNMAGRWVLASPGRGQCNMNFRAAAPTDNEGAIAPEGGCPGKFFTSRKWAYDSAGLSIKDHNSQPLAQLSSAGAGRFDGKAATGDIITLTR